jgi:hypothetical protein
MSCSVYLNDYKTAIVEFFKTKLIQFSNNYFKPIFLSLKQLTFPTEFLWIVLEEFCSTFMFT